MRDRHGSHPWTVVAQTARGRAGRASVFNCDIKILLRATTDSETTLWEESSAVLAAHHKCSLDPGSGSWYAGNSSGLCHADTKNPRKSETVHNSLLLWPINFKTYAPFVHKHNPWEHYYIKRWRKLFFTIFIHTWFLPRQIQCKNTL